MCRPVQNGGDSRAEKTDGIPARAGAAGFLHADRTGGKGSDAQERFPGSCGENAADSPEGPGFL